MTNVAPRFIRAPTKLRLLQVYAYYAFPPPASVEKACPPSSGPPALMDQGDLSLPSTPRMLQDMLAPLAAPLAAPHYGRSRRPMSAHERSKTVIKSLYDSLQSSKVQRKTRPQSAPSQRVQERLVQSRSVALFREFDRRLPSQANLQTLYFDAFDTESRPRSRPSSATFQRYATVAIADSQFDPALASRRPTSAGAIMRRSRTEPADSWEMERMEREHAQLREHREHEPSLGPLLNNPESSGQEDDGHEVDLTHQTHGKRIPEKQKNGKKASGINLEELRSLGMVWEKPQNAREATQDFSLEGPRQSLRPRQSRISVVIEQDAVLRKKHRTNAVLYAVLLFFDVHYRKDYKSFRIVRFGFSGLHSLCELPEPGEESDLQTWEMMLKKAAPASQKLASPEHSPRDEPGIGMPWTWQSSSIDAVDVNQHKDSLASREQTKSGSSKAAQILHAAAFKKIRCHVQRLGADGDTAFGTAEAFWFPKCVKHGITITAIKSGLIMMVAANSNGTVAQDVAPQRAPHVGGRHRPAVRWRVLGRSAPLVVASLQVCLFSQSSLACASLLRFSEALSGLWRKVEDVDALLRQLTFTGFSDKL
eukprot:s2041_g1.t1